MKKNGLLLVLTLMFIKITVAMDSRPRESEKRPSQSKSDFKHLEQKSTECRSTPYKRPRFQINSNDVPSAKRSKLDLGGT